jgi:hypothetical protein
VFCTNASNPTRRVDRCRGDDFLSYLRNYDQLLRPPFHSERPYKTKKKTYSCLRFYQGNVTGRAECLTHHNFRLTFAAGGRNHTNRLQTSPSHWFPECL